MLIYNRSTPTDERFIICRQRRVPRPSFKEHWARRMVDWGLHSIEERDSCVDYSVPTHKTLAYLFSLQQLIRNFCIPQGRYKCLTSDE